MPSMGAPRTPHNPALEGLRSWPVPGFEDIRVYYLVRGESLIVIRVLHGKRDINRILKTERSEDDLRH
jgi:toxin ParE1/3/4